MTMTRVDVQKVALVARSDGAPVFMADDVSAVVDDRKTMWLSFKDPDGNVFAIARLPRERAKALCSGAGKRL